MQCLPFVVLLILPSTIQSKNETLDLRVQDCWDTLSLLEDSVNQTWTKKLWDAWGRPPSGVLEMQRSWPGSYRECRKFSHQFNASRLDSVKTFRGRFCWVQGSADMDWKERMVIRIGVCLPRACSTSALEARTRTLSNLLDHSRSLSPPVENFTLDSVHCEVDPVVDDYLIGLTCLLLTLGLLVLLCTILDWFWSERNEARKSSAEILMRLTTDSESCFQEVPDQVTKNRRTTEPGDTQGNMYNLIQSATTFGFVFMKTGICSVDTFFVLSGFLLSFVFFGEMEKRKLKMNWILFYVHRFFRLTPSLLVVSFSYVALMPQLGSGPFWTFTDPGWRVFCKTNWWKNLLYAQNITNSYCAGWLWYLACDMQLYVISPFYLILLQRRPKLGATTVLLSVLSCSLLTSFLAYHYDLDPSFPYPRDYNYADRGALNAKRSMIFNKLYTKPYTRAGPYFAGLLAGFGVYLFIHKGKKPTKCQLLCGWIVASLSCGSVLTGMAPDVMPSALSALFNGFSHTVWGIAVAWLLYTCATGHAGFFNSFLSPRVWRIPSRLTYCAYLVHPLAIYWFFFSYKTTLIMTKDILFVDVMGFLLVSYLCALGVSLLVESPVLAIEKTLLQAATG